MSMTVLRSSLVESVPVLVSVILLFTGVDVLELPAANKCFTNDVMVRLSDSSLDLFQKLSDTDHEELSFLLCDLGLLKESV